MSHYTMASGQATSTVTLKCEGCGRRVPYGDNMHAYVNDLSAVCSRACLRLAWERHIEQRARILGELFGLSRAEVQRLWPAYTLPP